MKLFGNDSSRPRVSRDTADFAPISEERANRAREAARKKADKARDKAYKEYAPEKGRAKSAPSYREAKAEARSRRGSGKAAGRSGAKKAAIIAACVLAALLMGTAGFGIYVSGTDPIYPNVSVGGIDLGGMTLTEAAYKLETSGWSNENETVSIALPMEHTLTVTASEAGASVTPEQAAQTAYDYCHEGSIFTCLSRYIRCLVSGGSAEVEIDVDEAAVGRLVDSAVTDILRDLESSGVEVDEKEAVIRVVKGAKSLGVDSAELTELICTALSERRYGSLDYEPSAAEL